MKKKNRCRLNFGYTQNFWFVFLFVVWTLTTNKSDNNKLSTIGMDKYFYCASFEYLLLRMIGGPEKNPPKKLFKIKSLYFFRDFRRGKVVGKQQNRSMVIIIIFVMFFV